MADTGNVRHQTTTPEGGRTTCGPDAPVLLVLRGGRVGILFSYESRIPLPCFAGRDRISCQDTRVSSLWTPSGEHRPDDEPAADVPAPSVGEPVGGPDGGPGISAEQLEEFLRFQAEITSIPAVDLVANHAFGLQQLAMMHLMQVPDEDGAVTEPDLDQAGSPSTLSARWSTRWVTASDPTPRSSAKR
jgi:hypothetical protein